jgi:hypothetical protein
MCTRRIIIKQGNIILFDIHLTVVNMESPVCFPSIYIKFSNYNRPQYNYSAF